VVLLSCGYVRPCKRVQASDLVHRANFVYGQEDRQYHESHRYEDSEQELQVLEEEVTVDTGDPDKLAVADGEDILERLPGGHGRCNASCFRHKGSLVVATGVSILRLAQAWTGVLDLVEQTLPLGALLCVGMGLVQLPVAAQNQEDEYLDTKDDSPSRERGGEVLDALTFRLQGGAGARCRRWCWRGHSVL
jgi:hypothetical protein